MGDFLDATLLVMIYIGVIAVIARVIGGLIINVWAWKRGYRIPDPPKVYDKPLDQETLDHMRSMESEWRTYVKKLDPDADLDKLDEHYKKDFEERLRRWNQT